MVVTSKRNSGSQWLVLTRFEVRRRMGRNFIKLGEIEAFKRKKSMKTWVMEAIRALPSLFMALLLGSLKGHCIALLFFAGLQQRDGQKVQSDNGTGKHILGTLLETFHVGVTMFETN